VFFLAAYPPLVMAAIGLIRAYRDTGYPVGTAKELAGLVIGLGAVFAVVGSLLLKPILAGGAPPLERLLTAAYPALDFVLLIPVLLLLRISSRFRGGRIFRAWAALLAGLIALCAADILYAYFAVMEQPRLEPLVDATYVLSYLLLALGTAEQRRLLAA
jgi:membrane protease YdiL (CAAX protease family)